MVLATATLSNCYTPLPLPRPSPASSPSSEKGGRVEKEEGGRPLARDGGRGKRSLRRIHLSRSVLSSSTGSCLVEIGQTKVLCSVRGPRASGSSSLATGGGGGGGEIHEEGTLNVEVRYAPQFGINPETAIMGSHSSVDAPSHGGGGGGGGGAHSSQMTEEAELSSRLGDALSPAVRLDDLPKSAVDVLCTVLQSDGGVLAACVAASSVALADAGVGMNDLVGCCTVAAVSGSSSSSSSSSKGKKDRDDEKKKGEKQGRQLVLLADPTEAELLEAEGTVTVAMLPGFREVTAWEQTGRLPPDVSGAALEVCRDGCATMHKFMRNCLVGAGAGGGEGGDAAAAGGGGDGAKR